VAMTPEQMQAWTLQRELDERNRPMTDDEIETLLPSGYKVNEILQSLLLHPELKRKWLVTFSLVVTNSRW